MGVVQSALRGLIAHRFYNSICNSIYNPSVCPSRSPLHHFLPWEASWHGRPRGVACPFGAQLSLAYGKSARRSEGGRNVRSGPATATGSVRQTSLRSCSVGLPVPVPFSGCFRVRAATAAFVAGPLLVFLNPAPTFINSPLLSSPPLSRGCPPHPARTLTDTEVIHFSPRLRLARGSV